MQWHRVEIVSNDLHSINLEQSLLLPPYAFSDADISFIKAKVQSLVESGEVMYLTILAH
jgi:hypothetical protein